jgi:hypothetical protein
MEKKSWHYWTENQRALLPHLPTDENELGELVGDKSANPPSNPMKLNI